MTDKTKDEKTETELVQEALDVSVAEDGDSNTKELIARLKEAVDVKTWDAERQVVFNQTIFANILDARVRLIRLSMDVSAISSLVSALAAAHSVVPIHVEDKTRVLN